MLPKMKIRVFKGKIYTVNQAASWAECAAVVDGRFDFVGSKEQFESEYQPLHPQEEFEFVEEENDTLILPGFQDSHIHALTGCKQELGCNLSKAQNLQEALEILRQYCQDNQSIPWIEGSQWASYWFSSCHESHKGDNQLASLGPFARQIDEVVSDRPVTLLRWDGHSLWANKIAIQAAGITK